MRRQLTSKQKTTAVTLAAIAACDNEGEGVSRDDLDRILDWADQVNTDAMVLDCILNGDLVVAIRNDEICFRTTDSLSPRAQQWLQATRRSHHCSG